jgi:serine/threonine protein kinase/WD40 repeat protein
MNADDFDGSSLPDPLGPILEWYLARVRGGEHPSIDELAERYPGLAGRIREILPALVEIELAGRASVALPGKRGADSVFEELFSAEQKRSGPASSCALPDPDRLGDYKIVRRLGSGGMGIVYEAEHEALSSRVALKVIHPKYRMRPDYLRWFLREARAAARLHHSNIVTVFDYGEHDGVCFYAMRLIAGHSLDKVIEDMKLLQRDVAAARAARQGKDRAASQIRTSLFDPTPVHEGAAGFAVRSVSVCLLQGQFETPLPDSTSSLVSSLGAGFEETAPAPGGATEAPEAVAESLARTGLESNGQELPSAPSLSLISSSSSSLKSSWRYQLEIARIGAQVADGLDYAHKREVIHRDIKPHNLMLDALGNAWITDFGVAKLKQGEDRPSPETFAGTLRYMAPERLQGKSDGRDDIYALGASLYELLALRPVFEATHAHELIEKIQCDLPAPLGEINRQIHPDLAAIIARTLAKNPNDRYSTAGKLRDDLRRFIEGRPVEARPIHLYSRFWKWCNREPWLAGASLAAAAMLVALAIVSSLSADTWRRSAENDRKQLAKVAASQASAVAAYKEGQTQLFRAHYERARAQRLSRREGQRFKSLAALQKAVKIGRELDLPSEEFEPLRDEAAACMALPDLEPTGKPIPWPSGAITAAFDFDRKRYVMAFNDGTIRVCGLPDHHEVARLRGPVDLEIHHFMLSPDGRYLAITHFAGHSLTVWDLDGSSARVDDPGPVSGHSARFSRDSRQLALAHEDGELLVYDLRIGQVVRRWRGPGPASDLSYRPDETLIAVTYTQQPPVCHLVEAETGRLVRSIPLPARGESVAWSPDGATLAIACVDRKVYLCDAFGNRRSLDGHRNDGLLVAFHPAGTLLASNDWDSRLRLWDPVLGRQWLSVTGFTERLSFGRDGEIGVQREEEGFTPYRVEPAREYRTLSPFADLPVEYNEVVIQRDGRMAALETSRGIALFNLADSSLLAFLPIDGRPLFDSSGDLLTGGIGGVLRWPVRLDPDLKRLRIGPPMQLSPPSRVKADFAADRTGRIVAQPNFDSCVVSTPERSFAVGPTVDCRYAAISPDGLWLATGSHGKEGVRVWSLPDVRQVAQPLTDGFGGVRFSPDGKWLMTKSPPSRLWEVGSWREAQRIGGHGLCFSRDGRMLAVQDADKIIRLVETETARTIARLESPDLSRVRSAAFSPDGLRLIIATNDGPAVHVWDLGLIRGRLAEMGLDWDAPAYPDSPFSVSNAHILRTDVVVHLGTIGAAIPWVPDEVGRLLRSGDVGLAIDAQRRWVRLVPYLAGPHRELANILSTAPAPHRNTAEALAHARRAVELAPDDEGALSTLGLVHYRAGEFAAAIGVLEKSLESGNRGLAGLNLYLLALAQHKLDHIDQARRRLNQGNTWVEARRSKLPPRFLNDLANLRAEAEVLLGRPASELPDNVFAEP